MGGVDDVEVDAILGDVFGAGTASKPQLGARPQPRRPVNTVAASAVPRQQRGTTAGGASGVASNALQQVSQRGTVGDTAALPSAAAGTSSVMESEEDEFERLYAQALAEAKRGVGSQGSVSSSSSGADGGTPGTTTKPPSQPGKAFRQPSGSRAGARLNTNSTRSAGSVAQPSRPKPAPIPPALAAAPSRKPRP